MRIAALIAQFLCAMLTTTSCCNRMLVWTAFLAESANSIVDMEWQTVNPKQLPIEEFRNLLPFGQFHEDIFDADMLVIVLKFIIGAPRA
jgi:hypothetical protein